MALSEDYFYEPQSGHGLPHDPFKAIIAPRVIGWISTIGRDGIPNLAPYSFFGAFASNPPVIGFSSEGYKDSIRNIEETGEFVWNFTSKSLETQMNVSSSPVGSEVDEFALAGLASAPGRMVRVPHVADSPASMECKLLSVKRLTSLDGREIDNWLTLGQVVGVRIQRQFLKDGLFDTAAARPIMRAGYRGDYAQIGEMFEMFRPGP
ncbi:MAG: Nitrilotriacetate monooxygenase component B (EC [uncultured Paraburkholderia sp.]|nr:MAG: Nitrilotriacetate monooxygenase component B (EC [uncultured Paraburkholderia sp.]CAH2912856.1 MAG: Nitrilotriacetate monooxygenase component B (EC [uncultured Paraburkholderia sp.]